MERRSANFLKCKAVVSVKPLHICQSTRQQWEERWRELKASAGYFIIVVEDVAEEKVVGAATLLVEKKFIHQCGQVSV